MTTSRLSATRPAASWPQPDPVVVDSCQIALHQPRGVREGPASDVPILFLHGLRETAEGWSRVATEMPTGQRMLAPDLPGFGGSQPSGAYDLSSVAGILSELVPDVVEGPVDLVGHGWGASLAIALAAIRPELVRRLAVISGPWPPTLAAGPMQPAPGLTRRLRVMAGVGWSESARIRRGYLTPVAIAGIPRPERSLVLWGANDRLLPPRYGEKVVTALGRCVEPTTVEMITLPGLGAGLALTAPALVASSLCEFLRAS